MLLGQGCRKMLERNGTTGLGRSGWFRSFAMVDCPPRCAKCAAESKKYDSERKTKWFDDFGRHFGPLNRPRGRHQGEEGSPDAHMQYHARRNNGGSRAGMSLRHEGSIRNLPRHHGGGGGERGAGRVGGDATWLPRLRARQS